MGPMQCDMTGSLSLVLRLCSVCPQAPFCPQPQPLPADSWLAFCNNGRTWHLTILAKCLSKVDSSVSDWECCPPSLSRALLYRQRPSVESLPGSSQGHCQSAESRASAISEGSLMTSFHGPCWSQVQVTESEPEGMSTVCLPEGLLKDQTVGNNLG